MSESRYLSWRDTAKGPWQTARVTEPSATALFRTLERAAHSVSLSNINP